jgi:uncharacterized damage-inducible protein DinB
MMPHTGLQVEGPDPQAPMPSSADEIRAAFKSVSDSILNHIKTNWTDDTLQVEDDLYGFKWKRGYTLYIMLVHQTHHVGQMTVLMRQAGLKVPGIYGPSKEEWSQYNMPPPEV